MTAEMDIPFNIEADKMYSITVEPSPYVLGLERRVEQLEKREELVNKMYKALVDNGFIKGSQVNVVHDFESCELEDDNEGGRNEYELIVGRELMMDVDEIDWQGRETPPPFLERENNFVSEAAGSSQPPDITNEGSSDVLAASKPKEDVIETGGDGRVSGASTEAIKTSARRRGQKLTSVNRHNCLTCDEDFSQSALYRHCQTTGHGKYCADTKFYTASTWKRHLSHCTEVHDESTSSGSTEAIVETRSTTSLKRKTSRPIQKPKASSIKKVTFNWSCMQCDKSYSLEDSLQSHCRKQKPRHGMYCIVAGKWFYTDVSWKKHTSSCLFKHQRGDASIGPQPITSGSALLQKQVQRTNKYSILEACAACKDGGDLLWCSNVECPVMYHLSCLDPPLKEVPEGDWFCTGCEAQREAQHRASPSPEQQVELAEGSGLEEQHLVAAAVSSMMASKGNQQREGTITARKTKIGRGGQMRDPKPKEPVESVVEQDGVNQSSSVSQNDDGTDLMGLQLENVIGDGNNVGRGAEPDSIPALKLRVLGKILAELESMQGSNSNAM